MMAPIPGLRRVFRFPRRDARQLRDDVDEEMRFHLEMRADELVRRGLTPVEASAQARREFGDLERTREFCCEMDDRAERSARRADRVEAVWKDVRYAVRALRRSPGFTVAAVLTLALGIGAATTVYSVVRGVLLRPLALPDSERLALVWTRSDETPESWISLPELADLRERSRSFEGLAALRDLRFNLTGAGEPEEVSALAVSANLFPLLGVRPVAGRPFVAEEDRPGARRVALLGYGLWRSRFGGDPGAVGGTVTLDGESYTVVGVLPPDFRLLPPSSVFPRRVDVWIPLEPSLPDGYLRNRDVHHLHVIGRLREGVTMAQARADVEALGRRLRSEHPGSYTAPGWGLAAVAFHEQVVRGVRPTLRILMGAVVLLLLIVCANVSSLVLARNAARTRELAVRTAIGAGRGRILGQLLTENLVLAVLGGAGGVLAALAGVHLLRALGPRELPRLDEIAVDAHGLAFALAATFATALLFGAMPALQASRVLAGPPAREGGRGATAGPGGARARRLLVVAEIALAMALLIATGLLAKSFLRLQATSPGFTASGVLTMRLTLPDSRYGGSRERAAFLGDVAERAGGLPGVRAVGAVSHLPLSGAYLASSFRAEGGGSTPADTAISADHRGITPGYFRALGIPLLRGREFTPADGPDAPPAAIIDEMLARRLWPGEDPVGKRLRWLRGGHALEVVGVVRGVRHAGLADDPRETVYRPYAQYGAATSVYLAVRGSGDPAALAPAMAAIVREVDPDQPVADVRTMADRVRESSGEPRFGALLVGVFAGAALLLAALGVYGVMTYTVAGRTREIGIRLALGARPADVLAAVARQGASLALVGIALGLGLALASGRVLSGVLYRVSATDASVYAGVPLLLAAVAAVACWLPARRAARVDPAVALRAE